MSNFSIFAEFLLKLPNSYKLLLPTHHFEMQFSPSLSLSVSLSLSLSYVNLPELFVQGRYAEAPS